MKKSDNITRIRHMIDAAVDSQSFLENKTFDDLLEDRKLTLAIVQLLQIIEEN